MKTGMADYTCYPNIAEVDQLVGKILLMDNEEPFGDDPSAFVYFRDIPHPNKRSTNNEFCF